VSNDNPHRDTESIIALSRRAFLQSTGAFAVTLPATQDASAAAGPAAAPTTALRPVRLLVNGQSCELMIEPRVTLLDALRESLGMVGTKKGCDRGQCGACTVLIEGRRVNACLTLAAMHENEQITTIEGLGSPEALHPMQAAFIDQDAFQCGYCTPGQICSAVAMLGEFAAGGASAASPDVRRPPAELSDDEIRERMSGNLCRCGAYPNIVAAVKQVRASKT
jgi:xanthine dehydrogenase YagT iron-sulfur-binding subunit